MSGEMAGADFDPHPKGTSPRHLGGFLLVGRLGLEPSTLGLKVVKKVSDQRSAGPNTPIFMGFLDRCPEAGIVGVCAGVCARCPKTTNDPRPKPGVERIIRVVRGHVVGAVLDRSVRVEFWR